MRTLLAALALTSSAFAVSPLPAFADGIEAPPVVHHRAPRPHRRAAPAPAPVVAPVAPKSDNIVLPIGFFGDGGGVGLDIGTGYVGGGSTTIVNGGNSTSISMSSSSSSSSSSASSNSSSNSGSHGGGGHGGGHRGGQGGGNHPGGGGQHGGGGGCGCQ